MIFGSVIETIGQTPMVELSRIGQALDLDGRIIAKLDYLLPGFSKKDRAARSIVTAARENGSLRPGQTVVELTSGNMGTGLAIVCGVLGHPFVAVMSAGNSSERAKMMRALGAEVVIVPQSENSRPGEVSGADLALVDEVAKEITAERNAFRADQFCHFGNPEAHETGTGPEIWAQSEGTVTAFCDFAGSGGTLAGVTRFLAQKGVNSYAVEPAGAEALSGSPVTSPEHPIQGGGYAMNDLDHLRDVPLAGYLSVSGEDARKHVRQLARMEGIFGGYSAGANLAGAVQLLKGPEKGGCVAIVICDSGLKYLSTDLWETD
ncbi:cysteine synthase A [Labrenzia sp. EL_126]|nr:cysteine synthase A [Labrenzia sp. EL_126]